MPKIEATCPECGTVYYGSINYSDGSTTKYTLKEPCLACVKADKMAEEVLGNLYTPIRERKK